MAKAPASAPPLPESPVAGGPVARGPLMRSTVSAAARGWTGWSALIEPDWRTGGCGAAAEKAHKPQAADPRAVDLVERSFTAAPAAHAQLFGNQPDYAADLPGLVMHGVSDEDASVVNGKR
ncbi:hypothetical protein A1Q2_04925 [Trichosporon asahii var. asahii CBS 8904]|uniref:Uncharacterized protein n=1 Tax=Trichosporon asahii var. asahii (strain CBS 8904) TaxID=1220162 RepID=K1VVC7_TRIAC|nr:hypothetical protein A1Q2_04925 [Trichosporon asahii var. asahii CBS 8904]